MWHIRPGIEHNFIDGRTHVHHVHLYNSVTGGEHNVDLLLGVNCCRECKRPYAQSDLGLLDPVVETAQVMEMLKANHNQLLAYIRRHGVPIRLGELAHDSVDTHHRRTIGNTTFLHPHRLIEGGK